MFDEADRLLTDESFQKDLTHITENIPSVESGRQTFLFSATMASDYDRYIKREVLFGKSEPVTCTTTSENDKEFTMTVKGLKQ